MFTPSSYGIIEIMINAARISTLHNYIDVGGRLAEVRTKYTNLLSKLLHLEKTYLDKSI